MSAHPSARGEHFVNKTSLARLGCAWGANESDCLCPMICQVQQQSNNPE